MNELLTRLSRQPAAKDPPELQALLCDLVDVVLDRRAAWTLSSARPGPAEPSDGA